MILDTLPSIWGRRFVKGWAQTLRGQRMLEELLDFGYLLDPPPITGGARNFDGVDDQVNRGADDASLDIADSQSCILQCLCKLDAVGTVGRFITGKKAGLGSGQGYGLWMSSAELSVWECHDGTDSIQRTGITMTAGTWVTFTGILTANAAANDDLVLYNDLNASATTNSTVLGTLGTTHNFRAGVNGFVDSWWDGDIAFTRQWNLASAAWSAAQRAQVVEVYNRLVLPAGWGPGTMGIQWVLWDAGSPSTTRDLSGNGLTGTYTGTTFVDDPKRVIGPGGSPVFQRTPAAAPAPSASVPSLRVPSHQAARVLKPLGLEV